MFFYLSLHGEKINLSIFENNSITLLYIKQIKSDQLLGWLDQVLKKKKQALKRIRGIVLGPTEEATFSGSRGITNFVNVLGFALNVPVTKTELQINKNTVGKISRLGKKARLGTILRPKYSREPNITASRLNTR